MDDERDIAIGSLRLKLATSNATNKRLQRLNFALVVCNVIMFAFAIIVGYLCVKGYNK